MLMNDDPTKYRHDRHWIWLGRYRYANSDLGCNETYNAVKYVQYLVNEYTAISGHGTVHKGSPHMVRKNANK